MSGIIQKVMDRFLFWEELLQAREELLKFWKVVLKVRVGLTHCLPVMTRHGIDVQSAEFHLFVVVFVSLQ